MSFSWDFDAPSHYVDFSKPLDEDENLEKYFGTNIASALSYTKSANQPFKQCQNVPVVNKATRKSAELRKLKEQQRQWSESPKAKKSKLDVLPNKVSTNKVVPNASTLQQKGFKTVPKPFHFATDGRIVNKENLKSAEPRDFVSGLRHYTPQKNAGASARLPGTIPQPFNVASKKRKYEPQHDFVSLAQQIKNFHLKTPERWKGRGDSSLNTAGSLQKKSPTKAQSPNFHYRSRNRPCGYLGWEKEEEKQAEEAKKCQFKANPINKMIFLTPTGCYRKQKKSPTRSLDGKSDVVRARRRLDTPFNLPEQPVFKFKAQPVPSNILKRPVGIKPKEQVPATDPKTPPFMLKQREAAWEKFKLVQKEKEEARKAEAAASNLSIASNSSTASRNKIEKKTSTTLQPFSFDQRDAERWERKWQHIKEEQEREAQIKPFKAQKLPPNCPQGIPEKVPKSPTKPQPFHLELDIRGEERAEIWKRQIEEELMRAKAAAIFKAQPCTVLERPHFVPDLSILKTTEPLQIELHTDKRYQERQKYDQYLMEKEKNCEEIRRQREAEREEEERQAIAILRKKLVHKAQPVPQYKPLKIQPSDKELTAPQTPNLLTKLRAKK